ncbi:hypothetical protein DSO57_1009704 [Entomophthora muscae]|uniref:Uncharacterized protein n=1 Tax=Entomophthora muscae TaxID=34485 RepID=A0ACC2UG33_9FUNG|nr:hypothetical protein DSO57_1009704 [Entomophthora muscae]
MDPDASPKRYLPDKEEVNEDLLCQVLTANAITRRQTIQTEVLPSCESVETVSIPYAEQLPQPSSEVN